MSILRIEHNSNVKVRLISLGTYVYSHYILHFMYIYKENKVPHDTILSVAYKPLRFSSIFYFL